MPKTERVNDKYRQYSLLAAFHDGKYKGRAWRDKILEFELESDSIDSVLNELKSLIDKKYSNKIKQRGRATPKVEEYIQAFQTILPSLNDNQFKMLKAHYHAPDRAITATQLAQAAGYKSYSGANLHYGKIGLLLNEILCMDLPKNKDGTPIYTFAIAMGVSSDPEENSKVFEVMIDLMDKIDDYHWVMRDEVAQAIEYLGLDN